MKIRVIALYPDTIDMYNGDVNTKTWKCKPKFSLKSFIKRKKRSVFLVNSNHIRTIGKNRVVFVDGNLLYSTDLNTVVEIDNTSSLDDLIELTKERRKQGWENIELVGQKDEGDKPLFATVNIRTRKEGESITLCGVVNGFMRNHLNYLTEAKFWEARRILGIPFKQVVIYMMSGMGVFYLITSIAKSFGLYLI